MSKLSDWNKTKLAARMKAKETRPEKPRFGEEANLNTHLTNMEKGMTDINKPANDSYDTMQKRWDQGKSGGGDTFIDGLKAGVQRGSLIEDKKRMKKYSEGMEKLKAMVEDTNQRLYQEEKTDSARRSLEPRVYAYLEQAKQMAPDKRRAYIQGAMDEYNKLAGTDYRIAAVDDMEPWKVTVMDGGQAEVMNLMEFVKNNPEKELDLYLKSNEADNIERDAISQDAMSQQLNNAKMSKYTKEADLAQNAMLNKQEMQQSGKLPEGALMFDEITDKAEKKHRFEQLKVEAEKLEPTRKAMDALNDMENIFEKYPGLSTSFARWAESNKDGVFNNFLKTIVNQDERAASQELDKHAATLSLGTISQFKGQRPTDILKKLIAETNPSGKFTPGAFKIIKDKYMREFETQFERSTEANKGWENRYFPSYKNIGKKNENAIIQSIKSKDPSITDADIAEAQRRLNAGK
jgi:hypothetical protein